MVITKEMAREFYRDLCGSVYGNSQISSQGIMSAQRISEIMGTNFIVTEEYLWACAKHGITERQGGGWVV